VLGPRRTAPEVRQETTETPEAVQSWTGAYAPGKDDEDSVNPWAAVYGAAPEAITRQRLEELRSTPWRR
jgi:hypothetical protein